MDDPELEALHIKVALLGSAETGKTALAAHLCSRPLPRSYQPTNGLRVLQAVWSVAASTAHVKAQQQQQQSMDVELWDVGALSETVFQHDYLRRSSLRDVSVVAILVSLVDRASLVEAKRIAELFDPVPGARFDASTPKLVVLTKCDLFMRAELSRMEVVEFFEARGTRCIGIANSGDADVEELRRAIVDAVRLNAAQ